MARKSLKAEKERLKKVHDTQYDILKNLNLEEERVEIEETEETSTETADEVTEEALVAPTAEELLMEQLKVIREQAFEEGKIAGLQAAIIARMERNGYVTDQMRNDVYNNNHIPSLINWVKSFQ